MNMKHLLISLLSLGLAVSPAVMAKPDKHYEYENDRGHSREYRRDDNRRDNRRDDGERRHDDRRYRRDDNRHDEGYDDRRGHGRPWQQSRSQGDRHHREWRGEREHHWQGDRHHISRYHRPHGYSYRVWRHGDYVPSHYRTSRYVVRDYHSYRLYDPPHHHHWVRVDNDVVLAAITTGVVAAVVYNIFD